MHCCSTLYVVSPGSFCRAYRTPCAVVHGLCSRPRAPLHLVSFVFGAPGSIGRFGLDISCALSVWCPVYGRDLAVSFLARRPKPSPPSQLCHPATRQPSMWSRTVDPPKNVPQDSRVSALYSTSLRFMQSTQHAADRRQLQAEIARIVLARITPPVPAPLGIQWRSACLRIKDDDAV